jgi:hypothetical protein
MSARFFKKNGNSLTSVVKLDVKLSLICVQTINVPKTHDIKCCYEKHLPKYNLYKEQLQGDKLRDFKSAPS